MKIKLYCDNHCADFERTEEQLRTEHTINICPYCGQKLKIKNLDEIVMLDCEKQVKEYIDLWVREFGWDFVIDLVKKHKDDYAIGRLYVAELNRRGFKLKEE